MKLRLKNGTELEGTAAECKNFLAKHSSDSEFTPDPSLYYYSSSRKIWVEIATMPVEYAENALRKFLSTWINEELKPLSGNALLIAVNAGPLSSKYGKTIEALKERIRKEGSVASKAKHTYKLTGKW